MQEQLGNDSKEMEIIRKYKKCQRSKTLWAYSKLNMAEERISDVKDMSI